MRSLTGQLLCWSLTVGLSLVATAQAQELPGPCRVTLESADTVIELTTYAYDAAGNVVLREVDFGGDGAVDERSAFEFGVDNSLTRKEITTGIGSDENVSIHSFYYENGRLTREDIDPNNIGLVTERSTYLYDENGNLSTRELDYGADGRVSQRFYYAYDDAGRLVDEGWDQEGDFGDITIDRHVNYAYDEAGNQTMRQVDVEADGSFDEILGSVWEDGRLMAEEYRLVGANSPEYFTVFAYDDLGKLSSRQRDDAGDGVIDEVTRFEYDATGNLITETVGTADGEVFQTTRYSYTCP